jgi:hypothetical protein
MKGGDGMETSDCIVAFSFSTPGRQEGSTGPADAAIAVQILTSKLSGRSLPVLAQKGIAAYFKSNPRVQLIPLEEADLYKAVYESCKRMGKEGWKSCIMATHQDREELCVGMIQKFGVKVTATILSDCYDCNAREFFRRSRWRSRWCWKPLELFFYRYVCGLI